MWQATRWPRSSRQLRHLGRPARRSGSRTRQRGWKAQPGRHVDQARRGALDRQQPLGAAPGRGGASSPAGPRCRGARAGEDVARPCRTRRPCRRTSPGCRPTSSATTPRSWVMMMSAELNSLLQVAHQVEDLRLDGHVERGGGLVGDQQLGVAGQRHRDHRALPHAAGELVRVVVDPLGRLRDARPGRACRSRACGPPAC